MQSGVDVHFGLFSNRIEDSDRVIEAAWELLNSPEWPADEVRPLASFRQFVRLGGREGGGPLRFNQDKKRRPTKRFPLVAWNQTTSNSHS